MGASSIQIEGIRTSPRDIFELECIRTFYILGHILGLVALAHFGLKNQTRKNNKIHKVFELYQVFMCQTLLIFSKIYIIYKRIEKVWSTEIRTFWIITNPNCLKYFFNIYFEANFLKKLDKKNSIKCQNVLIHSNCIH